jgi:hypothetical protein
VRRRRCQERDETRQVVRGDVSEPWRGRHALIQTCTGQHSGKPHAQRLDPERPPAPFDCLAPIIPTRGATPLGGLDRVALDADGARCGRAPCLDQCFPCPVVTPRGNVVLDGALGQPSVWQPIPWATAPVENEHRVQSFPQVHLARAPSSFALLGGWEHRSPYRPWRVRQSRGILLSRPTFLYHIRALLC